MRLSSLPAFIPIVAGKTSGLMVAASRYGLIFHARVVEVRYYAAPRRPRIPEVAPTATPEASYSFNCGSFQLGAVLSNRRTHRNHD